MMTSGMFLRAVVCIVALVFSAAAFAADADKETAVNKAGRQRMLSQRLAKAYLMVAMGVQTEQGKAIWRESLALADRQFAELGQFAGNEDTRRALTRLEREWGSLKTALNTKLSRVQAHAVYDANEVVQSEAHRLTLAFEALTPTPDHRLINIAGRQRMLSERLAKFYLFRLWGVNTTAAEMEFNMSRAEFSSGMHQLFAAAQDDPGLKAAVERLDAEWIRYRDLLTKQSPAHEVVAASEAVLVACENVVGLFERKALQRGSRSWLFN